MGNSFLKFYREKIQKEWKIAFLSAVIVGLLVHTYRFTNTLPSCDALKNYYSSQNMTGSGRWFLSIACGISSYFDLPWLIGIFSIFLMGLTSAVITDIYKIKNTFLIVLSSALLVSFPSITETFFFEFTADGYMLAMFMAACSVRLCRVGETRIWRYILSGVLLCLTCGIYQAYISFAMVLALTYFAKTILENSHTTKQYMRWILKQLAVYIAALGLYYVIWQLSLKIFNIPVYGYLGISDVGNVGVGHILKNLILVPKKFIMFFIDHNFLTDGITVWIGLGLLFLLLAFAVITLSIIKSGILKNRLHLLLYILSLLLIPYATYIWEFTSGEVVYLVRMLQCIGVFMIFIAVLCDKWLKPTASSVAAVLFLCIIWNNSVSSNIFYYYMNRCNVQTQATAIEISTRIHLLDTGDIKQIAVFGSLNDWNNDKKDYELFSSLTCYNKMEKTMLQGNNLYYYLWEEFDFTLSYYANNPDAEIPEFVSPSNDPSPFAAEFRFPAANSEKSKQIASLDEYKEMPCWPDANSVKVIGDTIVIKLSEQD